MLVHNDVNGLAFTTFPNTLDPYTQFGIGDRVSLTERVSEDGLPLFYKACDLFVLLSLKEGFGIVFLVAMRYAKPCIGARAAAVPEAMLDGETGLVTAPGDPRNLERAILTLLADEVLRRQMSRPRLLRLQSNLAFPMFRQRLEEVLCRRPA